MKKGQILHSGGMEPEPVVQLYKLLCDNLRGGHTEDSFIALSSLSWCQRGAVDAVAMPLPGAPRGAGVEIWLGQDATPADVPRRIRFAGDWVDFRVKKRNRPRVQAAQAQAAQAENGDNFSGRGTVGGLMRDRIHPERYYILSCGHVFAGSAAAKINDTITVLLNGTEFQAELVDWEPVINATIARTGLDAAIARITDGNLANRLRKELPTGVSSDFFYDHDIVVKAVNIKEGQLKTYWTGYVDIETTERLGDYYLENAIGYSTKSPTEAGDSGAAVWSEDKLLGIHVAAPIGDERWRSNAILCPINRIMQWFDIEPVTTSGGTSLTATPATAARVPLEITGKPNEDEEPERVIVAKTIWGEARGEGEEGMRAVACVIGNRKARHWRNKDSFAAVCLDRWQFSCWNENDLNRIRLETITRNADADFTLALSIADCLLRNQLSDFTFGATHYFSTSLKERPYWARAKTPCYQLGKHIFFNDID